MNCFNIDKTDFGIDSNSSFTVSKVDSMSTINIEINSNEELFNSITESDDSEWSWALYAPKFYFNDFPILNPTEFEIELTDDLLNEYDIAIYMMEHCDITGSLNYSYEKLTISGKVSIMGDEKDFRIEWAKKFDCLSVDENEIMEAKKPWWKFWH